MSAVIVFLFKMAMLVALFSFLFQMMRLTLSDLSQTGSAAQRTVELADSTQEFEVRPDLIVERSTSLPSEKRYHLVGGLTMGRSSGSDIVLEDTYVSSAHARIYRLEGKFYLEDLGSTNGTYLNDIQVVPEQPQVLKDGYQIMIGDTVFRFQE